MLESGTVSEDKKNPVFDEQTLARLLEAAFVLQEHGHELRKLEAGALPKPEAAATPKPDVRPLKEAGVSKAGREVRSPEPPPPRPSPRPPTDGQNYSSTLAEIVETQHEIEVRQLTGQDALALIANRLIAISGARGVAIARVKGDAVSYRVVAGIGTLPAGSEVPLQKALCASAVRSGEVFTCADVNPQLANGVGRGVGSLIVVPVAHETEVIGALEVYYSDPRSFTEQDLNSCQLSAGMVGEALAAEKPIPGTALASGDRGVRSDEIVDDDLDRELAKIFSASQTASALCSTCGQKLVGDEQFCVECGAPRKKAPEPTGVPNKAVPYWLQIRNKEAQAPVLEPPARVPDNTPPQYTSRVASREHPASEATGGAEFETSAGRESEAVEHARTDETPASQTGHDEPARADIVSVDAERLPGPDWSSALSARQFLEQIASGNRKNTIIQLWNSRRGDVYLAIAIIVVISVVGFGLRSGRPAKPAPPPAAAAASHKPAQPELSPFDRMLISLGLAEAPPPPEEKGNPTIQVWIDLHTGLYYCPGTDLYGKTTTGKYATQRDAELDQYQPAYRKTCE